jgi:hypothetical protein
MGLRGRKLPVDHFLGGDSDHDVNATAGFMVGF